MPQLQRYDGTSPITLIDGPWYKQHDALWKLLVPGKGQADNESERLMELAVKWVSQNPEPVKFTTTEYRR